MSALTDNWLQLRQAFPLLTAFAINLIAAFAILFAGLIIARWIRKRLRKSKIGGSHVDATLRPALASAFFYVFIAMTLYAFLRKLGVDAASLLAIFGAAGLAIGLALKDTLSNIASGVMLLVLRPLEVGEHVDTAHYSGTVQEIGLFATIFKNSEGLYIYVPNSTVWNSRLTNFDRHIERRLTVNIGVKYDTDLETARDILLAVMNEHEAVQELPAAPECWVINFGESAITLSSRCWLPAQNWTSNGSDIRIKLKTALDKAGIEIALPQRVIHQAKD